MKMKFNRFGWSLARGFAFFIVCSTSFAGVLEVTTDPAFETDEEKKKIIYISAIPPVSETDRSREISFSCTATPNEGTVTEYLWNFGPDATPSTSEDQNPGPVKFSPSALTKITKVTVGVTHIVDGITCADKANPVTTIELWPAQFKERDGTCFEKGFDPPLSDDPAGTPPWTSVVSGATNQLVKVVVPSAVAPGTKLVITEGSDYITLNSPQADTALPEEDEINIEIAATAPGTDDVEEATIELQSISGGDKLAELKVMILPEQELPVGIYAVSDPASNATAPVNGPSTAAILTTMNEIFKPTGVSLTDAGGARAQSASYDSATNPGGKDGRVQGSESTTDEVALIKYYLDRDDLLQWDPLAGKIHLYLAKQSGIIYPGQPTKFKRGRTIPAERYSLLFVDTIAQSGGDLKLVSAHEVGHVLGMSVRITEPDHRPHDEGPTPPGTTALMRGGEDPTTHEIRANPGRWISHEDWKKASETAKAILAP